MKNEIYWCEKGWQPLSYGFCPSKKAWKKQMKDMGLKGHPYPEYQASVNYFTNDEGDVAIVTVSEELDGKISLIELIGLIVHESTHVWQEVKRQMREKKPSVEFEAYSIQAISQNLIEAFEKTRGLPK